MAESGLSISYSDLMLEVGNFLGYGPDPSSWRDSEVSEVDRYIQAGIRQFYYPPAVEGVEVGYEWSFLSPSATIDTADGDAAQDLPDDLARIVGDLYYEDELHKRSIVQVSEAKMLSMLQRTTDEDYPRYACVRHKAQTSGSGQRLEIMWYPIPNGVYTLTYNYEAYNGKLSDSNPYPLGGMRNSELVLESCLAIAEQRANDEKGSHTESFYRLLASSVAFDRKQGATHYGNMGQPAETSINRCRTNGNVTYNGETW